MKQETSLQQVKIGAGKSTLIYSFIFFLAVAVTLLFFIMFFPDMFGMSASSNKLFVTISFIAIPIAIFISPTVLFLFGYSSKKYQKKYLNGRINAKKTLITYHKKMIVDLSSYEKETLITISKYEETVVELEEKLRVWN